MEIKNVFKKFFSLITLVCMCTVMSPTSALTADKLFETLPDAWERCYGDSDLFYEMKNRAGARCFKTFEEFKVWYEYVFKDIVGYDLFSDFNFIVPVAFGDNVKNVSSIAFVDLLHFIEPLFYEWSTLQEF